MFSKSCTYGIRAVLFIAQKSAHGHKTGIKEISAGIDAPEPFLAKILQLICRKGIIQSSKGPNGGFFIDKNSGNHSLADIVEAIDGEKLFTQCALGLPQCSALMPCPLHEEFHQIRQKTFTILKSCQVTEFNKGLELGKVFLKREPELRPGL